MADNNYVDGAKDLGSNYLSANPYAEKGMLINKFPQVDNCKYYASVQYLVDGTGASATITPLTGNLGGDLRYYRVEIYDGKNTVTGELDLNNRTTDFVIDTSTLNPNVEWIFAFYGSDDAIVGDVGCDVAYKWAVASPINATGDTVPPVSAWDNVKFLIKLVSSTDANYTLFPDAGVELSRDSVINLQDYSVNSELLNGESYEYKLFAKKVGLNPSIGTPTIVNGTNEAISSVVNNVTFPFPLSTEYKDIANLEAETGTTGSFSDLLKSDLINEGVTPFIQVKISTLVV